MHSCLMFRSIPEFEQKPRPRKWTSTLNTSSGGILSGTVYRSSYKSACNRAGGFYSSLSQKGEVRVTISTQASISRSSEGTQEASVLKSICIDKLVYPFWYSPRSKPQTCASRTLGNSTNYYNDMIMGGHIIDNRTETITA